MTISAFDIIGPAMVGPSSSHTAGAVRLGLVARALTSEAITRALLELHGSFAATGHGHATDRALVAGLHGFRPDDERLKDSLGLAKSAGLEVEFGEVDLGDDAHPNSVRIRTETASGEIHVLVGSSVGGGRINVEFIDGFAAGFSADRETLVLWNQDHPGYLAEVTTLLANESVNIATIRTSRLARGTSALTLIEMDSAPSADCLAHLEHLSATQRLRNLHPLP